jgi:hypothetical protein
MCTQISFRAHEISVRGPKWSWRWQFCSAEGQGFGTARPWMLRRLAQLPIVKSFLSLSG